MPRQPRILLHRRRHSSVALAGLIAIAVAAVLTPLPGHADEASDVRALAASGDLPAALRKVDGALVAKPQDAQLRFLRGVVLMDSQRDEAALGVFAQLSQEFPELPDPYNNIALLHARAGRLEMALAAVQEALRVEPSHRTARANLGQLHLMLAVKAWESLALGGPVDPALQRRLEAARALLTVNTGSAR